MKIHKRIRSERITFYYFTKTKNNCLMIEYDSREDFGEYSTSGVQISNLKLHYQNGWITDDLPEIKISEVPKSVLDILSFLSK